MSLATNPQPTNVRPPAVAGFFYPGDARELAKAVRRYLAEADSKLGPAPAGVPKAIIVPHAGYIYSGLTAAAAYRALAPARGTIRRVVMMGPCHRVAVRGLALPSVDAFRTPLGDVAIDKDAVAAIAALPQVEIFDATHKQDHALEVHLPFLQTVLGDFKIVPMIVGDAQMEDVARVIDALWGGPETLILISSDLSHYLPYDEARALDGTTRAAIERLDGPALVGNMACGRHSIRGLLMVARAKGLRVTTADLRNSGDTAGPKDKVVGYGSWLLHQPDRPKAVQAERVKKPVRTVTIKAPPIRSAPGTLPSAQALGPSPAAEDEFGGFTRALLDRHGTFLLQRAARAILAEIGGTPLSIATSGVDGDLARDGAAFVTLEKDGKLRGCIGSVVAHRPLVKDVTENACRAAFQDPRFSPLTRAEIAASRIDVHISVLGPQVEMRFRDEDELLAQIRPGRDGLVLQDQGRRGVFLPVVWESVPEKRAFLTHLKRKAGLPETHWSETVKIWRYVTEEVRSEHLPAGTALWAAH